MPVALFSRIGSPDETHLEPLTPGEVARDPLGLTKNDARRDAKVGGVRFHDLRHFYASALISAGCSVKAVQKALGHASATETLETYAHLWPEDEDRTRKAIQGVFSPKESAATAL